MPRLLRHLPATLHALLRKGLSSRIVSGFVLVACLTVASKGVSFVKDATVARHFGTGDSMDAFLVAFGLLAFLAALAGGGMPEAFLPAYTETALKSRRRACWLAVQALALHAASLLALAGACYFGAPWFIQWATRGFSAEKQALAVLLLRSLLPFLLCFGLSYQLSAWLRADKRFLIATSAQMLIPLAIMLALVRQGADSTAHTLVTGTVAGAVLHVGVLAAVVMVRLPRSPRFWRLCLRRAEGHVPRVWKHAFHYLLAGGIFSSSVVVDQTMAAWLAPGSVAVLGYTEKLCGIILAVTVAPSSDVLFPYFADRVARLDWAGLKRLLFVSISSILALALPAVLLLCWLAPWVVALLFERGSFTADDTLRVAYVLRFAALQIPFYIVGSLASRVVVAMQATQFILWVSALGLVVNAGLNFLLMRSMGTAGIALSTVIVQMVSAGLACLYVLAQIRKRLQATPH